MFEVNSKNIKKVYTVERSPFEKKFPSVVLDKDLLYRLELEIPARLLFNSVKKT
ncbi:MAG: hypothetical protein H6772_00725 [Pseudomonadales bacterium]|nr:hypothetical protein [Pseudomonadales bacterium]